MARGIIGVPQAREKRTGLLSTHTGKRKFQGFPKTLLKLDVQDLAGIFGGTHSSTKNSGTIWKI
jgi:hypothetical protein